MKTFKSIWKFHINFIVGKIAVGGTVNFTTKYSFEAGGNVTQKLDIIYGTTDRIYTNYKYEDSNWKDKLTEYNGKPITYDAIGNPKTYDGYTYTWE
jgi:hypothetical protein